MPRLGENRHGRMAQSAVGLMLGLVAFTMSTVPQVEAVPDVFYELNVTQEWHAPDGFWRRALAMNGQLPGPTLRVTNHGRIVIAVTNLSPDPISVHWHGIEQHDGGQWYDGVSEGTQCPLYSGETMVYNFTVDQEPGLMTYHGHCYANEADGLAGIFIIDPNEDPDEQDDTDLVALAQAQDWDEEILVNMHDWYHDEGNDVAQKYVPIPGYEYQATNSGVPYKAAGEADSILINGLGDFDCLYEAGGLPGLETSPCYPLVSALVGDPDDLIVSGGPVVFSFDAGKRYLMRFTNTGIIFWLGVTLEGHEFLVISVDGVPVEPFVLSQVDINVGERFDVIVEATGTPGQNYTMAVFNKQTVDPATQTATIAYSDGVAAQGSVGTPWTYAPMSTMANYSGILPFQPTWVRGLEKLPDDMNGLWPERTIYFENYQLYDNLDLLTWPVNKKEFKHDPSGLPLLPLAKYGLMKGGPNQPEENKFLLKKGEVIDLVLVNHAETWEPQMGLINQHAWHLHGMKFWVLGYGPGRFNRTNPQHQDLLNLDNPPRRDMATLYPKGFPLTMLPASEPELAGGPNATTDCYINDPRPGCQYLNEPFGWTVLRIKAENPGVWAFHCHQLSHYLQNLKAFLIIAPEEVPDMPESMPLTCGAQVLWDVVRGLAGLAPQTSTRLEGQVKQLLDN